MPRALRSSRFVALALLVVSGALHGQDAGPTADQAPSPVGVLLTAPEFRRGIDSLPANVIPHWAATYRAALSEPSAGTESEIEVEVLLVDAAVEPARSWVSTDCRSRRILAAGDGRYYHENPAGWSIVVIVPATADRDSPVPCEFVDLFVSRYQFFQNSELGSFGVPRPSVLPGRAPAFPAILSRMQ